MDRLYTRAVLALLAGLAALGLAPRECSADPLEVAHRIATPEYREAIEAAMAEVDPEGEHPDWADQLYRICKRESRCGQDGSPGAHAADSWAGRRTYARAVERGRLDPVGCLAHRLEGRTTARFSTRGGWGLNAALWLWQLGPCEAPEELDKPHVSALVAARMLAWCHRGRRPCTCSEHTALWVGAGILRARPLVSWLRKSRVSTVAGQCGDETALAYLLAEVLREPLSWPSRWAAGFSRGEL